MLQKLRTIIYHVNDLDKAKAWYTELSGTVPYFDEPFYVGFNIGGFELGLDPDMENISDGNHSTAYWGVADIDAAVARTVEIGGKIIEAPKNVGGTIMVATIADPFGNYVGFISGD